MWLDKERSIRRKAGVLHTGRTLLGVLLVILVCPFVCGVLIGRLMSGSDIRFVVIGLIAVGAMSVYMLRRLVRRLPRTRTCNREVYQAVRRLVQSDLSSLLMYEGKQIVELSITYTDNLACVECQNWRIQGSSSSDALAVLYVIHSDGTVKKSRMTPSVATPHGRESTTVTIDELDRLRRTLDTYPLKLANT